MYDLTLNAKKETSIFLSQIFSRNPRLVKPRSLVSFEHITASLQQQREKMKFTLTFMSKDHYILKSMKVSSLFRYQRQFFKCVQIFKQFSDK